MIPAFNPLAQPTVPLFRLGQPNRCPSCGNHGWHVGRSTAECMGCGRPLPLEQRKL